MPKRGISRFSIENLLSHSTEKLRKVTLLCFKKFLVSKKFMDKGEEGGRGGGGGGGGEGEEGGEGRGRRGGRGGGGGREYHDFLSKVFCLTLPKNFVGEPFCAVFQEIYGNEKVYG